ncbi:MAG: redoxin domain-containing protein [Bacteroidales bacterium]|nr:redoxin domain-containing protein [Bacteroidales bacterium]
MKQFLKAIIAVSVISICLCFLSCTKNENISISGNLKNAKSQKITLEKILPLKVDTVKSCKTDSNGDFRIEISDSAKHLYRLRTGENSPIFLCLQNGDKVKIEADVQKITDYQIEGSEDCMELKKLNQHLLESTSEIEQLRKNVSNKLIITNEQLEEKNKIAREIFQNDKQYLTEFIERNQNSLIAYFALHQYVSTTPIFNIASDTEIYETVLAQLKQNYPQHEETQYLESQIRKYKLQEEQRQRQYTDIREGGKAPNFTLEDENGNKIRLEDFSEPVCLCFWASWDSKSTQKVQEYLKGNTKYKPILISLDTNKEKWQQGVSKNNLGNHINVCDFQTWEGITAKMYGIKSIPVILEISVEKNIEKIYN